MVDPIIGGTVVFVGMVISWAAASSKKNVEETCNEAKETLAIVKAAAFLFGLLCFAGLVTLIISS